MANYEFESVIQPFTNQFTPISDIKFFPNEIFLQEMKVNVSITPHDIEQGYLGFMAGDETRTMKDWPLSVGLWKNISLNKFKPTGN